MDNGKVALFAVCACIVVLLIGFGGELYNSSSGTGTTTPETGETVPETEGGSTEYTGDAVSIVLGGNSIVVDSGGATVSGGSVTITAAGSYRITGTLDDGQVIVDTEDEGTVNIILAGADINCSTNAPINVINAEKIVITLEDGTENFVTDGTSYVLEEGEDEPNAAVFSKDDLTITGGGSLTVDANYNDGIASKDGIVIEGGTITVTSVDDGIRGKDYLIVKGGVITLEVGGDGLKSDNDEDAGLGYITIEAGTIDITSGGDAVQAVTDVHVVGGVIDITSGGGSGGNVGEDESAKGIKGTASVVIDGGAIAIDSADDAVHSNGEITINGGTLTLASGDDGAHADTSLTVNGGIIDVTESYEGLESAALTINAGEIYIVASDDGLNAAGGNDSSGTTGAGRMPGRDTFTSGNYILKITGGYVYVDAQGDGVDINGSIEMSGGTLIVNGPTSSANGAIDYDSTFNMTGGILIAVGSSGMALAPSTTSTQCAIIVNLRQTIQAGTLVHIQTSSGEDVLTFRTVRSIQSIVFSSPDLEKGVTYDVYYGGSSTGTAIDGLYEGGKYTAGTKYTSVTLSGTVTTIR